MSGLSGGRDSTPWQERLGPVADPLHNLEEMWRVMEMFFSNADRASWGATTGQGHEWDPESTYQQGYMERGAPEPLAQALALYSQVMEPDVVGLASSLLGGGARAAQGVARAAPTPSPRPDPDQVYHALRDASGRQVPVYRAQAPGGLGPYAQHDPRYAQSKGFVRYGTDSPEAMRHHGSRSTSVFEGQMRARPHGYLDLTGQASQADPVTLGRLREHLAHADPDGRLLGSLEAFEGGQIAGIDLLKDMQRYLGDDLGQLPRQIGLDIAGIPHNKNTGRPISAAGQEYMLFNRDAYSLNNAYDFDQFAQLFGLGR